MSEGLAPMTNTTIDYAPELGKRFVTVLEEWLTPEEFEEMRTRNDTRTPGVCASHDFCDANMAMDQAWRDVVSPDGPCIAISQEVYADPDTSDADIADLEAVIAADSLLWARAWDWAIEHYLSHSPVAMALEEAGWPEVIATDRASLIRWLVGNDPNGSYTDEERDIEGVEPHSLETLIGLARDQGATL